MGLVYRHWRSPLCGFLDAYERRVFFSGLHWTRGDYTEIAQAVECIGDECFLGISDYSGVELSLTNKTFSSDNGGLWEG